MKTITIEQLLQWALREELPKGKRVSTEPWQLVRPPPRRRGFLPGARTAPDDGLGFVAGEPHADARTVARAIDALPGETRLTRAECAGLLGPYAALDAQAIAAVAGAAFAPRHLVTRCAVLAEPMPWDVGLPQPQPWRRNPGQRRWAIAVAAMSDRDGIVQERIVYPNTRGNYPVGSITPVIWSNPSVGVLLELRAEYTVWHRAMRDLIAWLSLVGLSAHALMPHPASPPAPWRTGPPQPARLHQAAGSVAVKLPLQPERPRAGPPLQSAIEQKASAWTQRRGRVRPPRAAEKPAFHGG